MSKQERIETGIPMRGCKYRTVATVCVSAFLGAAFYYLLVLQLSPPPSHSWGLEEEIRNVKPDDLLFNSVINHREREAQRGSELRKFRAKMQELNRSGWNKSRDSSHLYNNCSDLDRRQSLNCSRSHDFAITWPFHFPQPRYSKSTRDLLQSRWVINLQAYLKTVDGKQVSVVTSSIEHTDILFNWLISAHLVAYPPLKNILVLTLDKSLHDLAESHGFSSLYVSPEMVIDPKAEVKRVFSQVHIVRLAVVRLMNHYGFDVVNYDCDAILLKNPQTIFDSHKDADLIGTFGKGPNQLFVRWGVTLNTGVMLLRSSAKLGWFCIHMSTL